MVATELKLKGAKISVMTHDHHRHFIIYNITFLPPHHRLHLHDEKDDGESAERVGATGVEEEENTFAQNSWRQGGYH